jgi:AraC-like DNA-binding protein
MMSARIEAIQHASGGEQLSLFIELLNSLSFSQELLPLASGSYSYSMSDPEGMRIASVYNYIMHNYSNPLTLEEVAAQAHLTPTAFCRYFKKHTRYTFVHFVNKVRVNEACKMLVNGAQGNIAAIAYNCGFNSITNFNYVFKSITGSSPREYMNGFAKTMDKS